MPLSFNGVAWLIEGPCTVYMSIKYMVGLLFILEKDSSSKWVK